MRDLKKLALELEKNPESFKKQKLLEQIKTARENAHAYSFAVALNFVMEAKFGKKPFKLDYSKKELLEGLFQLGYFFSIRNKDSFAHIVATFGTDIVDGNHFKSDISFKLMFLRMMTAFEMGLEEETKEYYEKLKNMEKYIPEDFSFDYFNALGLVSSQLLDNSISQRYFTKALKYADNKQKYFITKMNMVDLYYASGEYDKSIELLEELDVPNFPSFRGYSETGKLKCHLIRDDLDSATKAARELENLNIEKPNWIDYWYSYVFLGHYYLKISDIKKAKKYLEKLRKYPDFDNSKYVQGECLVLEAATRSSGGKKIEGLRKSIEAYNLLKNYRTASPHLKDLVKNLQNSAIEIFEGLLTELGESDNYTAGHTVRVSQLAFMVGKRLKLNRSQLFNLAMGAMLHDYGKLIIPSEVLNKPSELDSEEMDTVKKHPVFGSSYLQHLDFPSEIVSIVKYHHERFDGSGYPEGLREKDIPLLVQIVAIVDVFDALTTDRPYRKALTAKEAREYIKKDGKNIASKRVIEALLNLIVEEKFIRKDVDFKSTCVPILEEILKK
ncbi:MAG: HD-GYP domain-containing protein [Kosmotogaceae bacterium]